MLISDQEKNFSFSTDSKILVIHKVKTYEMTLLCGNMFEKIAMPPIHNFDLILI